MLAAIKGASLLVKIGGMVVVGGLLLTLFLSIKSCTENTGRLKERAGIASEVTASNVVEAKKAEEDKQRGNQVVANRDSEAQAIRAESEAKRSQIIKAENTANFPSPIILVSEGYEIPDTD